MFRDELVAPLANKSYLVGFISPSWRTVECEQQGMNVCKKSADAQILRYQARQLLKENKEDQKRHRDMEEFCWLSVW